MLCSVRKNMINEEGWNKQHLGAVDEESDIEFAARRQAALDNASLAIAYYLEGIYNEMKRSNDHMIGSGKSTTVAKAKAKEVPRTSIKPQSVLPKMTPQNTEEEEDSIGFYKEALSEALTPEQLEKTQVSTDVLGIYIKFPYIQDRDTFGKAAGILKELGAEYKSAGKDTHFFITS